MKNELLFQSITEFQKVWGIGSEVAKKLYKQGMRTIKDLQANQHLLNKNQIIGLQFYKDF